MIDGSHMYNDVKQNQFCMELNLDHGGHSQHNEKLNRNTDEEIDCITPNMAISVFQQSTDQQLDAPRKSRKRRFVFE